MPREARTLLRCRTPRRTRATFDATARPSSAAGAGPGQRRQLRGPQERGDHVAVDAVGDERERQTCVGIGPGDLAAGGAADEGARTHAAAELTQPRVAIVTRDLEP